MGILKFKASIIYKVIWALLLIGLWEILTEFKIINPLLLPSLSAVFNAIVKGVREGALIIQLLESISLVVVCVLAGILLSILMAYLDYFYIPFRSLFELLSSMLHPLPGIALLPIVILWMGIGVKAVLIIILHAVLWSLYLNVKSGFNKVQREYIEVAGNNGATNLQLLRYVLLPNSLTALLTGTRIGWARGWRALIGAEMLFGAISSVGGIGWFLYERRAFMDTPGLFAGIVLVIIVGLFVEQVIFSYLSELIKSFTS